jgi:hypothetical protein
MMLSLGSGGGNPIQTPDLETAARLSAFAGALLVVAERHPKPPVKPATEPVSVRRLAESFASADRGSAPFHDARQALLGLFRERTGRAAARADVFSATAA